MPTSKPRSSVADRSEPLIDIQRVSFKFHLKPVLEHVTLRIERGDYLGLIGPNGAGKTTLLRILLGELSPTSGQVTLFGTPAKHFRDRTRIGYVPQKATQIELHFPVTVEEVVSLGRVAKAGLFRKLGHADRAAIDRALGAMDITRLRRRLLSELSGGEQQRVFIARALASEPEVLILDEPTVGVDVDAQEKFYELLNRLNTDKGGNLTLVLVSHDIDVVANEVTKLASINKKLIYSGSPREFLTGEYLEKLYGKGRRFILHGHG